MITLSECWSGRSLQQARQPALAWLTVALLVTSIRADAFPTPKLAEVNPAGIKGALVICGGGNLPDVALDRFQELAGGGEEARLIVVPTASERADQVQNS